MNYMSWLINTSEGKAEMSSTRRWLANLDLYYHKNRIAGPSLNTIYAVQRREVYRALADEESGSVEASRS